MNFVAGETTETVNTQVRKIIAKRLSSESKFTAPSLLFNGRNQYGQNYRS